jgi:hypothetical protein
VSSSGNSSRLWEKNKMLASLLAKQPPQAQTIPPIPTSLLQAQPNVRLPKVIDPPAMQQQQKAVAPQQPAAQQQQAPLEATAGPSGRMEAAADSSSVTRGWDSVSSANDEMLSDILDQVIEFVPENQMPGTISIISCIPMLKL